MSESERQSAALAAKGIRKGIAAIETPAQAKATLDTLEKASEGKREEDVPEKKHVAPQKQAEKIARKETPHTVLAETAKQVAQAPEKNQPMLDTAIAVAAQDSGHGRQLLREEVLKRLGPLDKADAFLFVQVNHLPHPRWLNTGLSRLSWVMTGGHAWLAVPVGIAIACGRPPVKEVLRVMPAIWCATYCVEGPVKHWFRRKRPFISIVQAIVVGRKPGSYSFPSGHSAAAFAGATLLAKTYPRGRGFFYALAGLVGFSRVFLGAHYPGDVVSGGIMGGLLAKGFSRLFQRRR